MQSVISAIYSLSIKGAESTCICEKSLFINSSSVSRKCAAILLLISDFVFRSPFHSLRLHLENLSLMLMPTIIEFLHMQCGGF